MSTTAERVLAENQSANELGDRKRHQKSEGDRSFWKLEITSKKVSARDVMHFSRQLAAFVRAGVPILDALATFRDEADNKTFKRVLNQIIQDVQGGSTFSDAVAVHGKVFPRFYVGMLQSAELAGNLDVVLAQIASYMERDIEARRKIKSALAYPAIILVMAIGTVLVLTLFVLPRFEVFFESLDATLPLPTRMLLAASAFLSTWWWAIAGGMTVVSVLFYLYQRTIRGRMVRDRALLRIPALGQVIRYSIIERFCRILASLVDAGVPLPQAMNVVSDTTSNRVYRKGIDEVKASMLQGNGLSQPISETGLFPATATQMIRVGEDTGTLSEQLDSSAQFFEHELDYKIKNMTTLFEPAVLVFIGVIVGFVAIALVSAMYGIFRQAGTI